VPDADIRIEADLELLKQLLLHLGGNAVKFTAPAGRSGSARARTVTAAGRHVSDSGIGIPENQLERISSASTGGQSLVRRFAERGSGWRSCKSIVEVHGGSIAVESAVGDGSTFHG